MSEAQWTVVFAEEAINDPLALFKRRHGCPRYSILSPLLIGLLLGPRHGQYVLLVDVTTASPNYQTAIPKRVREQFDLKPGQVLQVIAMPGRIELVTSRAVSSLRGFLEGKNTFERESDRL